MDRSVSHDERSVSVQNASYRWGYLFLSFGLLIVIALRAFFLKESNWDLMALVMISGLITTAYQGVNRIFTRSWIYLFGITLVVAALVAAVGVFLLK